ncbi:MAG: DinB family protein [Bacteroidota bacterium]
MQPKLKAKMDHMDHRLSKMIEVLDGLNEEQLHHKPGGQWSPAQIFQHLLDSEVGTTNYLKKKLNAKPEDVPRGGISALVRYRVLARYIKNTKKKYRAPKVLADIPENPDYPLARARYQETRATLRSLLEPLTKNQVGRAYFKHPRAGRMNILHTLGFLELHLERHFKQIHERIKT